MNQVCSYLSIKLTLAVIVFILLLFFSINSKGQVIELFKGWDELEIKSNDSIVIYITNTDTIPIKFYPLTVFDNPNEYLFLNDTTYLQNLKSQGGQIQAIREIARIVKSPYFNVYFPEYDSYVNNYFDSLIAYKQFSIIGSKLSVSNRECFDYWLQASTELIQSEIFSPDSLRDVATSGHYLGECIIDNNAILVDFTPGQPRFLDTIPGTGKYISAHDIKAQPEWLDFQDEYCYQTDTGCVNMSEWTTEHYKRYFTDDTIIYYDIHQFPTMEVNGSWILCPGCTLSVEYHIPSYLIDLSDINQLALTDSVSYYLENENLNVALSFLQELLGNVSQQEAERVLSENDFFFYYENPIHTWLNYKENFSGNITMHLHIPSSSKPIEIGKDLQLPFLIHQVHASSPVQIGDTLIQEARFELWNKNFSDSLDKPKVTSRQIQYLQSGYIPENTLADIEVYYNQYIYKLLNGIRAEMFGNNTQSIQASLSVTNNKPTTDLQPVALNKENVTVFPNPAIDKALIHANDLKEIYLFNSDGKQIPAVLNGKELSLRNLDTGMYFLVILNGDKIVTKQIVKLR